MSPGPGRSNGTNGWARVLYRLCLELYPRRFRERFGDAMESAFLRLLDEAEGPIQRAMLVARELGDLLAARLSGRFRDASPEAGGPPRRGPMEWLLDTGSDLVVASRALRSRPTYALVTVLVIGLGVGSGVAVYTVVHEVLLKPLPYRDPGRIVIAFEASSQNPRWDRFPASAPLLREWRERSSSFAALEAYRTESLVLVDGEFPSRISGIAVTPGTFAMLGSRPLQGRTLGPGDVDTVVVSEGLWRGALGADPGLVGTEIHLDGRSRRVVGIMPAEFRYPPHSRADVWMPLDIDTGEGAADPDVRGLMVVGRLQQDVSVQTATRELSAIAETVADARSEERLDAANVMPAREMSVWAIRPVLWVLSGAVGLLVLIVLVNLTALGLARGLGRAREIAIRAAIGAGRGRLVRLLVSESLLLSVVGGVLGVWLASWGVSQLTGLMPAWPPSLAEASVDLGGLLIGLGLAAAMTVSVGLVPGLGLSRIRLAEGLREGGRAAGESLGRMRFRQVLVVTQLALAVILLFGASLMSRSMSNILAVDLGMDPEGVLTAQVSPGTSGADAGSENTRREAPDAGRVAALASTPARVQEALRALPELEAVSYADSTPNGPGSGDWVRVQLDGRTLERDNALGAEYRRIGPGYLELLRVELVSGRKFGPGEVAGAPRVALVNERFVEMFLPDRDPLGATFDTLPPIGEGDRQLHSLRIVGVFPTLKERGPTGRDTPRILVPFAQDPSGTFGLLLRPRSTAGGLLGWVRAAVASVDAGRPVGQLVPLEERLESTHRTHRVVTVLMLTFAVVAGTLALVGLYGVMAHNVTTRLREFAVRVALGARPDGILRLVLSGGLLLGVIGIVVGGLLALPLARGANSLLVVDLLVGVDWWDPLTAAVVPVLVLIVVALASVIPARRAARVAPRDALQADG